jgi:TatD DNase family protein
LPEAQRFIDLGYFIGLNGCSMKTVDNLDVIRQLPLEKIVVETGEIDASHQIREQRCNRCSDAPWCGIKSSHASHQHVKTSHNLTTVKKEKWSAGKMVKDRNEPCTIV